MTAAALSPDGQHMLIGRADGGFAHLWRVSEPAELEVWYDGHTDAVHAAAFVGGGRTVVTASLDGTARVWEAAKPGKELHRLVHPAGVRAVAATSDGKRVVTGCDDGKVRLWDPLKERELELPAKGAHRGRVRSVALTADGLRAVSGGGDGAVRVWTLPAGE